MDGGDWIALAGVVITGGFSVWSAISARQARTAESAAGARADEALKAERAAVAAQRDIADQLKRAADLREADALREGERHSAIDDDPWLLESIPGKSNAWLVNRSAARKYGIHVDGFKVHGKAKVFDSIGAGKREEISIARIGHPDDDIVVTWHNLADQSDPPRTSTESLPPRI